MNQEITKLQSLINDAKTIVIIQADNPDGDSLSSSLALEQILHDLGKEPAMYCAIDIPAHLKYLSGWDRVTKDLPNNFDASIIVDCSSKSLLENLGKNSQLGWLASKPSAIIDHHNVENTIDFATVVLCDSESVSTGEVIYQVAKELDWSLDIHAKNMLAVSILSDSLGLMSDATTARSIRTIAELVEGGVQLAEIENKRRELMRKPLDMLKYKGELLQRVEFAADNRLAMVTIPWEEIQAYSHAYNPSILVLDDMRLTDEVCVAVAFKQYSDGKVTAKIRANYGSDIADKLAEHFGFG